MKSAATIIFVSVKVLVLQLQLLLLVLVALSSNGSMIQTCQGFQPRFSIGMVRSRGLKFGIGGQEQGQERYQHHQHHAVAAATTTATAATATAYEEHKVKDGISISTDADYPYLFTGRLWFSPSIVKVPPPSTTDDTTASKAETKAKAAAVTKAASALPSNSVQTLSLFGYTLGGTVTLEYDTSPVGPYREFVTMSSIVTKKGCIGQWGSRLYVSTQEAEDVCREVWGVPAEVANIEFYSGRRGSASERESEREGASASASASERDEPERGTNTRSSETEPCELMVTRHPNPHAPKDDVQSIYVEGWDNTRVLKPHEYNDKSNAKRWGNIPVLWTPTIKALWSPWVAGGVSTVIDTDTDCTDSDSATSSCSSSTSELPLHKLRLSASAIRLSWSGFGRRLEKDGTNAVAVGEEELGIPLGIGLVVDNVLIEIGSRYGNL